MSAHELHRQVVDKIAERRDEIMSHLVNLRFTTTMEDIAARTLDINAQVRAYTDAINMVTGIFRDMTEPDKDKVVDAPREPIY